MSDDRPLLSTARFDIVERSYRSPDGVQHRRAIVLHPGAVTILPVFDDGRICLIRNFRPAVGRELFELPAGTLEPDEPPLATAERELAERAGTGRAHDRSWRAAGSICFSTIQIECSTSSGSKPAITSGRR